MKLPDSISLLAAKAGVIAAAVAVVAVLHLAARDPHAARPPQARQIDRTPAIEIAAAALPGAVTTAPPEGERKSPVMLLDDEGGTVGYVVDTAGMPDLIMGYNGVVPVAVVLDAAGRVVAVRALPNDETPSYMEMVETSGFLSPLTGRTVREALAMTGVDTVSGATYTSRAMIAATRSGLASIADFSVDPPGRDWKAILVTAACALVLAFALACWAAPSYLRRFRIGLLLLNVAVPGLLGGLMLSVALFAGWILHGPALARPLVIIAAAVSVVLPFLTGRQFWCTHACPFGAASELAAKVPVPKPALPPAARSILTVIGSMYLLAVPAIMIALPDTDLALLEPFPAFSLVAAPAIPAIMAAVFLTLSMFFPKIWCRFLCPTGRVVNFFSTGGKIFDLSVKKKHSQSTN